MNTIHHLTQLFASISALTSIGIVIYILKYKVQHDQDNFLLVFLFGALFIHSTIPFFNYSGESYHTFETLILMSTAILGPSLFLYTYSKFLNKNISNNIIWTNLGLMPIFLIFLYLIFPPNQHEILWTNWIPIVIKLQWISYLTFSAFTMREIILVQFNHEREFSNYERWIIILIISNLLLWISFTFFAYYSFVYMIIVWFVVFGLCGVQLYFKNEKENILSVDIIENFISNQIHEDEIKRITKNLNWIMENDKPFKDSNLTIKHLAKMLHIKPSLLSQIIEKAQGKVYEEFINEYRIEEAKLILKSQPALKVSEVSKMCGFKSISTFYSVFKKMTLTTPSKYAKS